MHTKRQEERDTATKEHDKYTAEVVTTDFHHYKPTDKPLSLLEILFLWYINGHSVKNPNIAFYWTSEYHIGSFKDVICSLINMKYLTLSDYKFNMTKCKLTELKVVLQRYNLPISGNKPDLIKRLTDSVSAEQLAEAFNNSYFQITEKGNSIISKYEHIIYYHQYRNTLDPRLNLHSVDSLYKETTRKSVEEFFIDYHTTAMYDYWNTQKYGAARNALLSIAEIYFRLPQYEQALAKFLSISYLDMTGLDNCTAYRTSIDEIDIDLLQFAPGIISYIVICLRNLDATVQDLPEAFNLAVANIDVPSSVYSKQEVLCMLTEAIVATWET